METMDDLKKELDESYKKLESGDVMSGKVEDEDQAEQNLAWAKVKELKESGEAITVKIGGVVNGGLIAYGWAGGKENSWYYSGNSSYGSDNENSSFLKINDGKCPWGISITCDYLIYNDASGKKYIYQIDDYGSWTTFAAGNRWADLLKTYWREVTGK